MFTWPANAYPSCLWGKTEMLYWIRAVIAKSGYEIPPRVGCIMSELLEIVEEVDPENLGICLDFGHANLQRPLFGLHDGIRELGDHLIATHIHDNEGLSDQHMIPLMGTIDWDSAIVALKEIGYNGPLILEVGGLPSADGSIRRNRLRLYRVAAAEITRDA